MSDSHERHRRIECPPGDVFIHCGDFSDLGEPEAVADFCDWLRGLPHAKKFVVPGNHDMTFDPKFEPSWQLQWRKVEDAGAELLCDREVLLPAPDGRTLRVYGSPWTPDFGGWGFMEKDEALAKYWANVPVGLDLLVTHGPPHGVLDVNRWGTLCGSKTLTERVAEVKPRVHVFGHIHEAAGSEAANGTVFHNVACRAVVLEL